MKNSLEFTEDKVVAGIVLSGGPTAERGVSGDCELLEFCGWTVADNTCAFEEIMAFADKPKDVVLRHNGQIDRYHFEDKAGIMWVMRYVTPEDRQSLLNQYAQWKKQKKNRKKK